MSTRNENAAQVVHKLYVRDFNLTVDEGIFQNSLLF